MWRLLWHLLVFATLLFCANASLNYTHRNTFHMDLANILEYSTILFPLTTVSNTNLVNKACHNQMQTLRRGILKRETWALKVLDASGSKPPAFMFGDNFWLGNYELCEAAHKALDLDISRYVEHKMNLSLLSAVSPFNVTYRTVYLEHESPHQVDVMYGHFRPVLHIGLCVPNECNAQEVMQLLSAYLESDLFMDGDLYELKPRIVKAKTMMFNAKYYYKLASFQLLIGFSIYTLVMTFRASLLRSKECGKMKVVYATITDAKDKKAEQNDQNSKEHIRHTPTSLESFTLCYDIQLNWSKIFAASDSSTNTFAFLNGGRVISALIATYFHTFIILSAIASNATPLLRYLSNIGNMDVAMDVFLLVSGFLQVYTFLQNKTEIERIRQHSFTQSIMQIIKTVFHRFLRLAPLYYFMICASYLTFHYLDNTSVFNSAGVLAGKCEHYWWRNLLFIHNLFDYRDICLIWTWHLSCEMQYSIVLTVLLVTYTKQPQLAKILTLLLIIGSLTYQAIIGINLNYQISLEATFAHFTELYMHPLARIFPYLAGAITSWLYLEYNSKFSSRKIFNNFTSHLIYLVFTICTQAAPFGREHTVRVATFILVLQRCCYVLSGCWSIIAMANKHLDWYRRILSAKIFQKVIHISYALSLLNCLLILGVFSGDSKVVYAGPFRMTFLYIGLIIVLHIMSLPMTLFFEMPYRNISNFLKKRSSEKIS
ncbi:PREDICTED: uncharacterized protein LOC108375151 [Rhagoletis zephyria]|uniref:uncharacterized protein LOC108375151 n=1 Tax=Rhagoletis zephyria TaxID=28612 RepID=UPI0008118060|nr:PREDICTED: uncharacterized protein LOC108375151 [Rhagoletis zephyria]